MHPPFPPSSAQHHKLLCQCQAGMTRFRSTLLVGVPNHFASGSLRESNQVDFAWSNNSKTGRAHLADLRARFSIMLLLTSIVKS